MEGYGPKVLIVYFNDLQLAKLKALQDLPAFEDVTIAYSSIHDFGQGAKEDDYDIVVGLLRGISQYKLIDLDIQDSFFLWYGTSAVITWFLSSEDIEEGLLEQVKEINNKCAV